MPNEYELDYRNMPDTRPLDVWGNPIGKPYKDKHWNDLTKEEMMADFLWKSDVLAAFGEEVSGNTFYQDYLFRELYCGELQDDFKFKVLLTSYDAEKGSKLHKIDVDDISGFLDLNDVALSPCLFYQNWRRKKLMHYISAFVLDIDKLRPENLQRFFMLFDEGRVLRPSFIANSGSGVHFYYVLDKMLPCNVGTNEANRQIAEQIYKQLYDDIIKKEQWRDAQRHWIGQDYRVVNSKTKLNMTSQIFKIGEVYSIDELIGHYRIEIDGSKHFASGKMVSYASSIARDLKLDPPDFTDFQATYDFIKLHKDAAYAVREERRRNRADKKVKKNGKRAPKTWYRNTLAYMKDHTQAGHRFSSMKALAIIAFKEGIERDVFIADLHELSAYWQTLKWKGDAFEAKNVPAIERLFDRAEQYGNTSSETLEEWLGYPFKRIPQKRNGQTRREHLEEARAIRDIRMRRQKRDWRYTGGAPQKAQHILKWRADHPDGTPKECIESTGISKNTVYKWWNAGEQNS